LHRLQAAETARQASIAAGAEASEALSRAQAQQARLSGERVQAAADLRLVEGQVVAAEAALAEARVRRADAERGLAQRESELAKIMPIMVRLARFPAETLLAVPLPPDRALEGLLITRGLTAQLEQEAAALRLQQQAAARLRAEEETKAASLARQRARQTIAAAALDRQIATAESDISDAERAVEAAARQAAALAAQAATLRGAIAAMDAAHTNAAARAEAEASALRRHQKSEAPAAEARAAALAKPAGPGLERAGTEGKSHARMVTPVAGPVLRAWGSPAEDGPATGMIFGTAPGAFVSSPCTGQIEFAAPFRSYGKLLIIACGGGYDVVLAGLGRLEASVGRPVRAGEPVGRMDDADAAPSGAKTAARPGLYMELRSSGVPQDPAPFLNGHS
jgi:septal ring factor EnvC (AmiA/AmiB activator)